MLLTGTRSRRRTACLAFGLLLGLNAAGCEEMRSSRADRRLDNAESRFDSLEARIERLERAVLPDSAVGIAGAGAGVESAITRPSGLVYRVMREGSGPAARPGQHVTIHETTTFTDGRTLYSTRGGQPLRFLLGGTQVIDGVDEGVTGMRVGERRRMIVAPGLSRRSEYPEGLTADDTLHYDVELVGIEGL